MSQVVFRVCEHKIRVRNCVVPVGEAGFLGRSNPRSPLDRLDSSFGSREADKTSIKQIKPPAQYRGSVTCGIGGNKNQLDLIRNAGGHLLERRSKIRQQNESTQVSNPTSEGPNGEQ